MSAAEDLHAGAREINARCDYVDTFCTECIILNRVAESQYTLNVLINERCWKFNAFRNLTPSIVVSCTDVISKYHQLYGEFVNRFTMVSNGVFEGDLEVMMRMLYCERASNETCYVAPQPAAGRRSRIIACLAPLTVMHGTIYMLGVFDQSGSGVFKLGKTTVAKCDRFCGYIKGFKVHFVMQCNDVHAVERAIFAELDMTEGIVKVQSGNEKYSGDRLVIMDVIYRHTRASMEFDQSVADVVEDTPESVVSATINDIITQVCWMSNNYGFRRGDSPKCAPRTTSMPVAEYKDSSDGHKALRSWVEHIVQFNPLMQITVNQLHKKRDTSGLRYNVYKAATTVGEYIELSAYGWREWSGNSIVTSNTNAIKEFIFDLNRAFITFD